MTEELKTIATAEAINTNEGYKTLLKAEGHNLIADEPLTAGGNNEGPAPGNYLCMALAACKAITLRMYVQRKQWNMAEIDVNVKLVKGDGVDGPIHTFFCEISVAGDLSDEQKERLVHISKACPIAKLLSKSAEVVTIIKQRSIATGIAEVL